MPDATAYNGVYRARTVKPPAGFSGLWVVVPRLNGDAPMGPCSSMGFTTPRDGTGVKVYGIPVFVATIAGIKDDLVILGQSGGGD